MTNPYAPATDFRLGPQQITFLCGMWLMQMMAHDLTLEQMRYVAKRWEGMWERFSTFEQRERLIRRMASFVLRHSGKR